MSDYPRREDDRLVWACCESPIGPVCEHLAAPDSPMPTIGLTIRPIDLHDGEALSPDVLAFILRCIAARLEQAPALLHDLATTNRDELAYSMFGTPRALFRLAVNP